MAVVAIHHNPWHLMKDVERHVVNGGVISDYAPKRDVPSSASETERRC